MDILTSYSVQSVTEAIALINFARSICLRASYHPSGGEGRMADVPITHTVWVLIPANYTWRSHG